MKILTFSLLLLISYSYAFNAYYIGNSLTDVIHYGEFEQATEGMGEDLSWGRHMIPGAPMDWIIAHRDDGISEKPYGLYPNALAGYSWDAVTMQPSGRKLDSDVNSVGVFISNAKAKSPNAKYCIYAQWPKGPGDWEDLWNTPYTGSWEVRNLRCADYYNRVTVECRRQYPDVTVVLVPNGHVMYELHKLATQGKLPGFGSAWDFYPSPDDTHLKDPGSYVVGCTLFSVFFGRKPEGFPTGPYGGLSSEAARIIQNTAWEVVSTNELCGVSGEIATLSPLARGQQAAARPLAPGASLFALDGRRRGPAPSPAGAGGVCVARSAAWTRLEVLPGR